MPYLHSRSSIEQRPGAFVGITGTVSTRTGRGRRAGRALLLVAALLAVGTVIALSSTAGSLPLSVGVVLLAIGSSVTLLQRLSAAG